MSNEKERKIKFAPNDKIDEFCHELVEQVFNIEGAFLTNESTLYDFEDFKDEIPGHKMIPISEVPLDDRQYYEGETPEISKPESYFIWYPSLTKEEETELKKAARKRLIDRLESVFSMSFADYPEEQDLFLWQVAEFLRRKLQ